MTERVMTCEEAAPLLDAFVDAELEGPTLIDVARHAASCKACDDTLQELIALHETLGRHGLADADSVDLSGCGIRSSRSSLRRTHAARGAGGCGFTPAWGWCSRRCS
jgi:anti-sigma factor RsiW